MTTFKEFLGEGLTTAHIAHITGKHAQDAMYRMAKLLKLPDAEISHNQIRAAVRTYVTDIFVVDVGDMDEPSAQFSGSMLAKDLKAQLRKLLGEDVEIRMTHVVMGAPPNRYIKLRAESEPL
jgi:hypothetical protein